MPKLGAKAASLKLQLPCRLHRAVRLLETVDSASIVMRLSPETDEVSTVIVIFSNLHSFP